MSKFVKGSYVTIEEAQSAIDNLISQGYSERDISLVANESVRESVSSKTDVKLSADYDTTSTGTNNDDDKSMWEKVKGAFTVDDYNESTYNEPNYNADEDIIYAYRDDIANGNILILVEGEPDVNSMNPDTTRAADARNKDINGKEKINLQEERLDVETNEVQTGEVSIKKNVTEETKTVEVPVKHEEVTINKRPVTGGKGTGETLDDDEEISIPITEEQIEVKKSPVVTDEVVIDKETKEETKEVQDTVRKEDIDVDTDGDVSVNSDDDVNSRS